MIRRPRPRRALAPSLAAVTVLAILTPQAAASTFRDVAADTYRTCATSRANGTLYCWGVAPFEGASIVDLWKRPRPVRGGDGRVLTGIRAVTSECAITANRRVVCRSSGLTGPITFARMVDAEGRPLTGATSVIESGADSAPSHCASDARGLAWCWGVGFLGSLGDGQTGSTSRETHGPGIALPPVRVRARESGDVLTGEPGLLGGIDRLGTGPPGTTYGTNCAILSDRTVRCWGSAPGDGTRPDAPDGTDGLARPVLRAAPGVVPGTAPTVFVPLTGVRSLEGGCAVRTDRSLWCWTGRRTGDPTNLFGAIPRRILGNVVQSSGGVRRGNERCAVRTNGTVFCWQDERVAEGTVVRIRVGGRLVPMTAVRRVVRGLAHTCALRRDGTLWCWGENAGGFLGDGTTEPRPTPVRVLLPRPVR